MCMIKLKHDLFYDYIRNSISINLKWSYLVLTDYFKMCYITTSRENTISLKGEECSCPPDCLPTSLFSYDVTRNPLPPPPDHLTELPKPTVCVAVSQQDIFPLWPKLFAAGKNSSRP
jgi:hypothetical protein